LIRVAQPGGRIALANWTTRGFIGSVLRAHGAFVPPPPGLPSVLAWGDEEALDRMLAPHRSLIRTVETTRRGIKLAFPMSPAGTVELSVSSTDRRFESSPPSVRQSARASAPSWCGSGQSRTSPGQTKLAS
jgi:hypothetical protein